MKEDNVDKAEQSPACPPAEEAKLGKFKDADALMKAYTELEAEFTRRSQRLKALEGNKAQEDLASPVRQEEGSSPEEEQATPAAPSSGRDAESGSEALYRAVTESEPVRRRVVEDFLRSLNKGVPLMTTGRGMVAPAHKPKTFIEAGSLALGYLKNKK